MEEKTSEKLVVKEHKTICVVTPELRSKINGFRHKLGVAKAGYPQIVNWNGSDMAQWDFFPNVPVTASKIYTGNEHYAYSHHQAICKFKEWYVASWSNGFRHEDHFGQEAHYSWSKDGIHWAPYRVLAASPADAVDGFGYVRNNAGLYADGNKLYAYVGVCRSNGNVGMGMNHMVSRGIWLDVYVTEDLQNWQHVERIADDIYLFEGPRLTKDGKLLCCGFDINDWSQGLVLIWEKSADPSSKPRMIKMPKSAEDLVVEQGTWYQRDDGAIFMYLREGKNLFTIALSLSYDGGETWSEPVRTDFPSTYARAHAGRLNDGRYYIIGNNYDHYVDRSHQLIALSDDGLQFDRMYTILNTPTTRRIDGYHKENGFHYPNSFADGDQLVMICSENKEDIVAAIVDTRNLI
jgi:hypothetical protein